MLKLLPHIATKTAEVPVYLIHFVTSKCNARCPHCFIFSENDPRFAGEALTLEQIVQLTKSLGRTLYNVCLTGGETFLRPDIEQICEAYLENTGAQVIQLFTNGWFEERAYSTIESLSRRYPGRNFTLVVSIDDLHDAHNDYRKLRNCFEKALRTYERVRDLRRRNVDLDIGLTVSHSNQDHLDEIYDFLVKERGYRTLSCTLVRGDPLDPKSKQVDLENYRRFADRLNEGQRSGELDGFKGFAGAELLNAKSVVMRELAPRIVREGYQSPCYAGRLIGVLYANGDVYPCEILDKPIGNVKDFGMSLREVWASNSARKVRDFIWDTKCHCTHECFQTVNLLFNPKYYPRLLWEYSKIKLSLGQPRA